MRSTSGARLLEHLHRAVKQRIGEVVVVARFDDEDARALDVVRLWFAPAAGRPLQHSMFGRRQVACGRGANKRRLLVRLGGL